MKRGGLGGEGGGGGEDRGGGGVVMVCSDSVRSPGREKGWNYSTVTHTRAHTPCENLCVILGARPARISAVTETQVISRVSRTAGSKPETPKPAILSRRQPRQRGNNHTNHRDFQNNHV